ncbi:MAG: YggS family pyridoxal phosphate-dependent enzyme [Chloroflexota bacterium]
MVRSSEDARTEIRQGIDEVQSRIDSAASRSGRSGDDITLVAVSKTVDRDVVDIAYELGLREFGENRVQDAIGKFADDVPDDLILHMIGPVQSNKARQCVGRFALIHSVDRKSLIDELAKRARAAGIVQRVLLQINVAREPQKHGCDPDDVARLLERVLMKESLSPIGFMMMAPLVEDPEQARPHFAEMQRIADRVRTAYPDVDLPELSMGMTNDFEVAIEEGATIVRVGRAIFHPSDVSE